MTCDQVQSGYLLNSEIFEGASQRCEVYLVGVCYPRLACALVIGCRAIIPPSMLAWSECYAPVSIHER